MNKKRVLSLALSLVITLPTAALAKDKNNTEHGQGNSNHQELKVKDENVKNENANVNSSVSKQNSEKGQANRQEAVQKVNDKKQAVAEFKTAMKAKHEQMKQLRQQTIALRQQIEQKRDKLSLILQDLKSGKKTLPEDTLNSLIAISETIQSDGNTIKETAEINTEVSDTQSKVRKADFNNALNSMDKVISKMQTRLDALNKLSIDLDEALKIANTATLVEVQNNVSTNTETSNSAGSTASE
ncbi:MULTISPECIES: hypothetical protein [Clostridium]|uniref:hypothetical protein n=1 Tax=Clostridium TaxID=1485 RepID=UPI00082720AA|nr:MULTISPECIES: hypothetical protein [Clostridium]